MDDPSPSPVVDPAARIRYDGDGLQGVDPAAGPYGPLVRWYADATADSRVAEPGAMVVATVDAAGRPNARTVLLKALTPPGLDFFTNLGSAKAAELDATPAASVVLLWHPMYRQVRVRGTVVQVGRDEAQEYFSTRPRGSQVAAWASRQSAPLASRRRLDEQVQEVEQRFPAGDAVSPLPLPPFWGGYRVLPFEVELWVGRESRLHDRLRWRSVDGQPARLDDARAWTHERLQP